MNLPTNIHDIVRILVDDLRYQRIASPKAATQVMGDAQHQAPNGDIWDHIQDEHIEKNMRNAMHHTEWGPKRRPGEPILYIRHIHKRDWHQNKDSHCLRGQHDYLEILSPRKPSVQKIRAHCTNLIVQLRDTLFQTRDEIRG